MNLIIFNPLFEEITRNITDTIRHFNECRIVRAADHRAFSSVFAHSLSGETVVVFLVDDEEDMGFLEEIHRNFIDIKLFTVLTNNSDRLRGRALKLQPRMITHVGGDSRLLPRAVRGVIEEMLSSRPGPPSSAARGGGDHAWENKPAP